MLENLNKRCEDVHIIEMTIVVQDQIESRHKEQMAELLQRHSETEHELRMQLQQVTKLTAGVWVK